LLVSSVLLLVSSVLLLVSSVLLFCLTIIKAFLTRVTLTLQHGCCFSFLESACLSVQS